ncbi:hypothetical protein E1B28_004385 [Marasmius oreades]|uniref:Actin cytoskeleton-regulatory complex protein SLA1 n=1 Tax=Marasmius oreades TaxID=181124 RepID=A0A9P8AD61_9AGAR|nr:uncharacterized protein E1B28_004385 [Marasmius oreades]KAG7096990.1 hypothetical protein E1B28_004385 [Marasmius oreades]
MSSQDSEEYLAVLKASYDYTPEEDAEDEVEVKEGQILFLLQRVDEDWWKVKIKGDSQEQDTPSGLVPAAYVEQAEHTSLVRALFDYEATAAGELSIKEDEILLAFDIEEEWLLAQSTEGGKAGFVPANYVETHTESEGHESPAAPQIVVPPSPPRPVSTYIDPADRVASAKANADDIKTWSVSEVDNKGKKLKGTLGIGNGAVFFASETSKAAVQKWRTADITNLSIEKSKHVHFDISAADSTHLHFHAGSKDIAEAIVSKLESSKAISSASSPEPSASTSRTTEEAPKEPKKASVHFSPASPTIIPPREPSEDGEYESTEDQQDIGDEGQVTVLYDFKADGEDELTVSADEHLIVLEKDGDDWWKCRNQKGQEGVVPASYVQVIVSGAQPNTSSSKAAEEAAAEKARGVSEAKARAEAQARAEADEAARGKAEAEAKAKAEAERLEREEEERKAQKKKEQERAEAVAAEAERKRRQVAAVANQPQPPREVKRPSSSSGGKPEHGFPPAERVRTWHDRTGQFRVDAALLSFKDGKLRLHKTNGVTVEVPSEKMSAEDMKFIEKYYNKKKSSKPADDEDNIPLAHQKSRAAPAASAKPKKAMTIDWFDFFLQAGCDLDDCTRYATSFERERVDETQVGDLTEGVMRTLGLREGDIMRVKKATEKYKPTSQKDPREDQIKHDEALAKQLEAQESGGSSSKPPNLFAEGPGGVLKNSTKRVRPQPSKSLPAHVDLDVISAASAEIQRTSSPQLLSPDRAKSTASPVQPPPRSSSTLGFDDDAWTNRPSSTKPLAPTTPGTTTARAPSAPPAAAAAASDPPAAPHLSPPKTLANTTEADIFDQLTRLSELKKNTPVQSPPQATSPPVNPTPPPTTFSSGLGMGASPVPMGQLQTQQTSTPQPYNGPRGPFAPVPANQQLLQPLVPTQTGFAGFVPTRATNMNFGTPSPVPSFQTGMPGSQLMMSNATGIPASQSLISQPTGMPFGNFNNPSPFGQQSPFQSSGSFNGPLMSNPTGFNPGFSQSPFNNGILSPPPVPPLPPSTSSNQTDTNPANIFAQMKSGTFATDNSSVPQSSDKYDALRSNPMVAQPTGWGNFQGQSFVGYR